jgi:hypothetical protein
MNRRIFLCAVTICAVSISAMAALPANLGVYQAPLEDTFSGYGYQAKVTSTVYQLDPASDGFLYTYQISVPNEQPDPKPKFTWFSVALNPGTEIRNKNWELNGIVPFMWEPVEDENNNPISIEAFFKKGLTFSSGDSALLWFTSPNSPDYGWGALSQNSGGLTILVEGNVLVPQVPEPMTLSLLGLGMLALRSFKRK